MNGTSPGGVELAKALADEFISDVQELWRGIVSNQTRFDSVTVENLYDDTELFDRVQSPAPVGTQGGEVLPLFNAVGLHTNRPAVGRHRGSKRVGLISESDINNRNPTPAYLLKVNTVRLAMMADLNLTVAGDVYELKPALFFFQRYITDKGKVAYKP